MECVDKKIKKLIKFSLLRNCRSLFVILGSSGVKQVPIIIQLLSKANRTEINALWFDNDSSAQDNLTNISQQTFHLAVLKNFDQSNLLALNHILPTVKGGGAIVILLPNVNKLEDIQSFKLNNEKHTSRFCKRFINSLNTCPSCMILDKNLTVLSSKPLVKSNDMISLSTANDRIEELKSKFGDEYIFSTLLKLCLTKDQVDFLFNSLDVLKKRTFHAILSVSSACGRGKSAALGLAIAGSLALNYSNIFIASSNHTNVTVVFQYLLKGLDALQYKEDTDYDLIESANPKFNKALIGLNVFRDHPQSVRFIFPDMIGHKLEQAELVVIDEAAAIPYEKLKQLIGPYVVLMASSISGANSTSPYVYDAMMENLQQSSKLLKETDSSLLSSSLSSGNSLQKFTISDPVHHAADDNIESWNNHIFCMQSSMSSQLAYGCPVTQQCQLFCVSRDVLFNGSSMSEKFLCSLVSIFNQSNCVIQPEDFIKLADSPDLNIFVLLPPFSKSSRKITPDILCAIMVHTENNLPNNIVHVGSNLVEPIPKCFNAWCPEKNSSMKGIHILNLATHPCYKRMGYGMRAFQLLQEMYEGKWISLNEKTEESMGIIKNSKDDLAKADSLLIDISELQQESVEYICVSFNLKMDVLSFWAKVGFVPSFLSTEKDSDTNVCFMLKSISKEFENYLRKSWNNFQNYYFVLLNSACQSFPSMFALSFLKSNNISTNIKELTKEDIDIYIKPYNMKSLERYCQRLQDMNAVIHTILILAKLYFRNCFKDMNIPVVQEAILLAYGLQNKSIDAIAKDLNLQGVQVIGLLNRTIKKLTSYLVNVIEKSIADTMVTSDVVMTPLDTDLNKELEEAANKIKKQQEDLLQDLDVSQYAIKGSEDEWQKALFTGRKTLVSIKSIKKKPETEDSTMMESRKKHSKKHIKRKKK